MTPVSIGGEIVLLRDQAPLHEGNVDFGGGWDFSDLVRDLNRRVFFWPGDERGPNEYGVRHFERYREDRPVILRVRLDDLLNHNKAVRPALCRYNSGSPRCSGGRRSPRGPNTFLPADIWPYAPSGVVEITFLGAIGLPVDTQVSDMPSGPWRPLFDTRAMRV